MLAWLLEPLQHGFIQRGVAAVVLVSIVCAVIGVYVILRNLAFLADALGHAVFPGVAVAALLGTNLFAGALGAGLATAVAIGLLARQRTISTDVVIGIVYTGVFAVGVLLLSQGGSYARGLSDLLFGSVLAVRPGDLWLTLAISALILLAVLGLHKELELVTFDPELARAQGFPVRLLDAVLYLALALAIMVALQTIGNVLVVALLVVPPATARLLVRSVPRMMLAGAGLAVLSGVVGLYLSYYARIASGAAIVLVSVALFLVVLAVRRVRALLRAG